MEKQQCLFDIDCPARLICTINAPWNPKSDKGYCECAGLYGWDDISKNCTVFSSSFDVQQSMDCLLMIFHSTMIIFFLRDFIYARRFTTIKYFSALSVTQQLIIVSEMFALGGTIVDMEDALYPLRYSLVGTSKVSAALEIRIACLLLSVFFAMTAFLNLSLSWAEVARSSKKLQVASSERKLNIYTMILRITQFVFFVNAVIAVATTKFDILVFATLPIGLVVIICFTIGSKRLIELLKVSGVASSKSSTHSDLANRIQRTSLGLVISIFLYLILVAARRMYLILYVRTSRADIAESSSNRPATVLDYLQKWSVCISFVVLAIYFNRTVRRRVVTSNNKSNDATPPHSSGKVKDSSEDKPGKAKESSSMLVMSVHTAGN